MRKPTQCERLEAYLEKHKRINPLEAWSQLGIYRLGARVFDLRAKGLPIKSNRKEVVNQFNEKVHVAEYVMEGTHA